MDKNQVTFQTWQESINARLQLLKLFGDNARPMCDDLMGVFEAIIKNLDKGLAELNVSDTGYVIQLEKLVLVPDHENS